MINITDKHNCCGCSACASICPKHCITMQEDEEGFLYPQIDTATCIDCGLCEKVCPYLNASETNEPIVSYAAKNTDEQVRSASSSGGIFTPIAEKIIASGGIVYGACFNDQWEVQHAKAETKQKLSAFRRSKYVQSSIGTTYKEIETLLKDGRKVLFSGTPCQVAGLRLFLRKDYDSLITLDIVCHGVPSPKIWREYVAQLPMEGVADILFKDKSTGWRGYSFSLRNADGDTLFVERASKNKYLSAFSRNLILRPSCFNCPAKSGQSHSDITLADFWGVEKIHPEMDDNKGTSIVLCNTEKGRKLVESLQLNKIQTDYHTYSTIPFNSCSIRSTQEPENRKDFWFKYEADGIRALMTLPKPPKPSIIKRLLNRIIKR